MQRSRWVGWILRTLEGYRLFWGRRQSGRRGLTVWASPLLVMGVAILSGLAGSRWFLNHGPLPAFVREQVQLVLAKGFGPNYEVEVGQVSFYNPVRVAVDQIRIVPRPDAYSTSPSAPQPLVASQLEMSLRWQSLVQRLLGNRHAPLPVTGLVVQHLRIDSGAFKGDTGGMWSPGNDNGAGGGWFGSGDDLDITDPQAALSKWSNKSILLLLNRVGRLLGVNPVPAGSSTPATSSVTSAPGASADRLAMPTADFSVQVVTLEIVRSGQSWAQLANLSLARDGPQLHVSGQLRTPAWPVAVEAVVQWKAADQPQVNLTARLASPLQIPVQGRSLPVREGLLVGVWQGDVLRVNEWRLENGQVVLQGDGLIQPGGGKDEDTATNSWRHPWLQLNVQQGRLTLPEGLPFLEAYGVSGQAQVGGVLSGELRDPEFHGRLTTGAAQLFHRTVRQVNGTITVNRRQVRFTETRVVGGQSVAGQPTEYLVSGDIRYPVAASGTQAQQPGQIDLTVRTGRGLLEEWLPAFLPGWDARGEVTGVLAVKGPFEAVTVIGNLQVKQGSWRQLHFEQAQITFRWEDGNLTLERSTATVGNSKVSAEGIWQSATDRLEFWIKGADLPLSVGEVRRSLLALPSLPKAEAAARLPVAGRFDVEGTLSGTSQRPSFLGTVASQEFQVGGWQFTQANGRIRWDGSALWVDGLFAHRQGGGTYTVSGRIDGVGWHAGEVLGTSTIDGGSGRGPRLNLDLQVDGEPAQQLLTLAQLDLPLVDGTVYGRGKVQGDLGNPRVAANLALQDGHMLGRPIDVGVDVILENHKVTVKQLHFSGSAWSIQNGQRAPGTGGSSV
ncbi:MAG: hypothetical protein IMX01_04400 [Limnochordaceae bacterium]|nr:hypothetical protein [Limnochordaceae bacterium]